MVDCLVIAPDVPGALGLLGVLSPEVTARVVLLAEGSGEDDAREEASALPVESVLVLPDVGPATSLELLGLVVQSQVDSSRAVVLDSSQASRDLAGWLSATLDIPLLWAIDRLWSTQDGLEASRVALGGAARLIHRFDRAATTIALAKPTGQVSGRTSNGTTRARVEVRRTEHVAPAVAVLEREPSHMGAVPLAGARVVVTVGRGIGGAGDLPLFARLADRVGAALGATRVVVDQGWAPFAHQVGQTGASVSPELYLAFGVSGAVQHLAGIRGARRVVAINTDPTAALCRAADVVVQADAVTVAGALLQRLDRRTNEEVGP